jgi:hypothetical protein
MFRADAARFDCRSGTILGRDVVPDVCRIKATSPASGAALSAIPALPSALRANAPAGPAPSGTSRMTLKPSPSAAANAGPSSPSIRMIALAFRSSR